MLQKIAFFIFFVLLLSTVILPTTTFAKGEKSADYSLAYPGILPDNPLYSLKKIRDKITPILITDTIKKVDFYVLQTDKGINAANSLIDKKNYKLALDTALKAENNMTLISNLVKQNPAKIKDETFERLKLASSVHQRYLKKFISTVPKEHKENFKNVLYFSEQNMKEITNAITSADKK